MKKVFIFLDLLLICTIDANREKRWVWYNAYSPTILGIQIRLPLAIALPTLAFNQNSRSFKKFSGFNMTEDNLEDYYWDPKYTDQLTNIDTYFFYMEVLSLPCQERLICELAVSPEDYSPVSDLILRELRPKYGNPQKSSKSLMWRYMSAARIGYIATPDECSLTYHECPIPAYKLLNMPTLKMAQYLQTLLGMEVTSAS